MTRSRWPARAADRCTPARVGDAGSASLWVLAGGLLVLLVAVVVMTRQAAVLARHRAESAADLAALAVASGIGIDPGGEAMCARGVRIAQANESRLSACSVALDADGRSGVVTVEVTNVVRLLSAGVRSVSARARAGRLPG